MYYVILAVASFVLGARYGQTVEKQAEAVALAAVTKAKAALSAFVTKAQADAAAEVARLEALAKKYL